MKKNFHPIALILLLTMACGQKQDNSLEGKKALLNQWKSELAVLNDSIRNLEAALAQLNPGEAQAERTKPVLTTLVEPAVFKHFLSVQGALQADENIMVTAKMPGMVTSILVKEGDFVKQGQVLASLDDEIIRKSIEEVKTGLELVNTMYEKQKTLWEQKIGTEMQYLNLKNQKEGLETKLATLNSQKSQTKIVAPFSGVIDEVLLKAGAMASPGLPLMRLVNTNELKVVANVPDSYVSFVRTGDFVQVYFPDLDKTQDARVSYVGRIVDPVTRTFKVEVNMPGARADLKPNLLALIRINDKTEPNAIVIDENIIQTTEEGKVVFVAREDAGRKRSVLKKVVTGLSYNGKVQIVNGLQPGEKLITTGYQDLVDNQAIAF